MKSAHQGGDVVTSFAAELVLIAKAQNVLDVGDEVFGVCVKNDIYEQRDEGVCRLIMLSIPQKALELLEIIRSG